MKEQRERNLSALVASMNEAAGVNYPEIGSYQLRGNHQGWQVQRIENAGRGIVPMFGDYWRSTGDLSGCIAQWLDKITAEYEAQLRDIKRILKRGK